MPCSAAVTALLLLTKCVLLQLQHTSCALDSTEATRKLWTLLMLATVHGAAVHGVTVRGVWQMQQMMIATSTLSPRWLKPPWSVLQSMTCQKCGASGSFGNLVLTVNHSQVKNVVTAYVLLDMTSLQHLAGRHLSNSWLVLTCLFMMLLPLLLDAHFAAFLCHL